MLVIIPFFILTILLVGYIEMIVLKIVRAGHSGVNLTKKNRLIALIAKLFAKNIFDV